MNKQIGHFLLNGSLTLQYDGQTKLLSSGDERFPKVLLALKENRFDDVKEIVEPERYFKRQGLDLDEGLVTVSGESMPSELNDRILEYQEQGLPFDSLLKFWDNLKKNPSFNSRQQLFKFLSNNGHSITADGYFIGYRGVTEDFKDKHSRSWDNSPGSICEMSRGLVDDNPNNTCSHGLHVGGYEYAKDFGPKLVMVKVNPRDVVAVPNDYNGQKMRVCRFEVLSEAQAILEETVVSEDGSEYEFDDEVGHFLDQDESEDTNTYTFDGAKAVARGNAKLFNDVLKHKQRYANNHAKRGPDGKFIAKKKNKSKSKKRN